MRRMVYVTLTGLWIAGCQPPVGELTEDMKADIAAEVDAAASAWWEAWAAVDYDRGMSFFEDVPEASWAWDEGVLHTVAGMDAAWAGTWCADCARQQIDFTDSRTIVLSPDIAYTVRQYDDVVTDTAGIALPRTSGVETIVWVRRDGRWKVLLGHESTLAESWQTVMDRQSR